MPTETVYGLAADATNGEAVARIYALKSRPQFNPLIVHVADTRAAIRYVEWNDAAERLAEAFWPGPLTLVLKRRARSRISDLVSAGGDTLAVRVPAHPIALELLQAFNGAIAAPSANRSGRVSPTTAQHVRDEFGEDAPLIVDGGACEVGLESTVLDISSDAPVLLRAGAITREMIGNILKHSPPEGESTRYLSVAVGGNLSKASPHGFASANPAPPQGGSKRDPDGIVYRSPGLLASHYAPSIPVRLNAVDVTPDEALLAFGPTPLMGAATTLNLSPRGDLIEAAANLFAYLRALDVPAHCAIAVMPIPTEGIGEAMMDRLTRASVGR
jgi:L-threonylcarbamoyladenylate synthase